jgi:hypothetical protein
MRRILAVVAVLTLVSACSKKGENKQAPPAAPKPAEPAAPPKAEPPPAVAPPAAAPPAAAAPSAESNGGIKEVSVYGDGPDGKPEAYAHFKVAAGEQLFEGDDEVAAWIPNSGNGGAGDDAVDVAIVIKGDESAVVLQTASKRQTLPLSLAGTNLEVGQTMFEERSQHRLMVRAAEINEPKFEHDTEAYLLAWDAAKHEATIVQHWVGKTDAMPEWAIPAPN